METPYLTLKKGYFLLKKKKQKKTLIFVFV